MGHAGADTDVDRANRRSTVVISALIIVNILAVVVILSWRL